jgi:hypothetical protein
MKNKKFAIFILTHGRPNNVKTVKTFLKAGYTGNYYIVIDNEDKTAEEYREIYGDKVIMFDKEAISKTFDEADNFGDRRSIVYARNACFEIAKKLKLDYFMQLDDDYYEISYKFDDNKFYRQKHINGGLDNILDMMLNYYKNLPKHVKAIAFAQCGDFIGGAQSGFGKHLKLKRKAMNTFFCSTKRPFQFVGRINEDVNTYTWFQSTGNVFLTIPDIAINQLATQQNEGGMTDIYMDSGTYIKSFYTVIFAPSCTQIRLMGQVHKRLHHFIRWRYAVPCLLNEKWRKK